MTSAAVPPFETILKLCRQASPGPWFPGEFAASMGIDPRKLDGWLDDLRHAGLVEPTEWQPNRGQGYKLTRAGLEALQSTKFMARVRDGQIPTHDEPEEVDEPQSRGTGEAVRNCLRNDQRPIVTYALFAANVIVFLVGMSIAMAGNWGQLNIRMFLMGGDAHARNVTGAVNAVYIDDGQWWRLLTGMFVHYDFFHLLINMGTFMAWGRRAEQMWGGPRFLLIYLFSGFVSVCVTLWHNPSVSPIGASGAICGVLLSLATWYVLNRPHLPREIASQGLRQVLFAFVWTVAWWALLSWLGGVKFLWVHFVSGAAAGAIAAALLNSHRFIQSPVRWLFLLLLPLPLIASAGLLARTKRVSPAWRDAVVAQKKKRDDAAQAAVAQKKHNERQGEFDRFNKELLPEINKAEKFIEKDWNDIKDLCEQDQARRNAGEVARARATVREAKGQTDAALAAIAAAGKLEVDKVADTTEAARRYLEEQGKLLELVERCLEGGEGWTAKEQKELTEKIEQTERSNRIYNDKFKAK